MYTQPLYGPTPIVGMPTMNNQLGTQGSMNGCGCQTPVMNQCNMQMMPNTTQYQGNVGTEPAMMQQPMMYPNMNMPYNY